MESLFHDEMIVQCQGFLGWWLADWFILRSRELDDHFGLDLLLLP